MDIFPEQPDIRPISNGVYRLKVPYLYETPEHYIIVPEGFLHDGASVPRLFWTISGLTPDGLHRAASLIHDYLYENFGKTKHRLYSRKECDQIFKDIMKKSGVNSYRVKIAYFAVRIGGWTFWNT